MFHIKLWIMFRTAHFLHEVSMYHAKKFHVYDKKFFKIKEAIDRIQD